AESILRNEEFALGEEEVFLKRTYAERICETPGNCKSVQTSVGYGIEIGGKYVFLFNYELESEYFENNILKTFNTRRIDIDDLSFDYFKQNLKADLTLHEALKFFGHPNFEYSGNTTIMNYSLSDGSNIVMSFRPQSKLFEVDIEVEVESESEKDSEIDSPLSIGQEGSDSEELSLEEEREPSM
ncbi:hypothetical protein V6O07_03520, partial [Arthrospira platensis SPKY2]